MCEHEHKHPIRLKVPHFFSLVLFSKYLLSPYFVCSCIEKWLKGQGGKCPQCQAKASRKDIRVIYAKALRVRLCGPSASTVLRFCLSSDNTRLFDVKLKNKRIILDSRIINRAYPLGWAGPGRVGSSCREPIMSLAGAGHDGAGPRAARPGEGARGAAGGRARAGAEPRALPDSAAGGARTARHRRHPAGTAQPTQVREVCVCVCVCVGHPPSERSVGSVKLASLSFSGP